MQNTIETERILNIIMTRPRQGGAEQQEQERFDAIAKLRNIPDWSVGHYLNNLYDLSLPVDGNAVTSFTDRMTQLVSQVRPKMQFSMPNNCFIEINFVQFEQFSCKRVSHHPEKLQNMLVSLRVGDNNDPYNTPACTSHVPANHQAQEDPRHKLFFLSRLQLHCWAL